MLNWGLFGEGATPCTGEQHVWWGWCSWWFLLSQFLGLCAQSCYPILPPGFLSLEAQEGLRKPGFWPCLWMLFSRLWPGSFPICSCTLPRAPSHGATSHCHEEVPAGPCLESEALPTGPWPLEIRSCLLRDGCRQLNYPLDWSPLGLTVLRDFGSSIPW